MRSKPAELIAQQCQWFFYNIKIWADKRNRKIPTGGTGETDLGVGLVNQIEIPQRSSAGQSLTFYRAVASIVCLPVRSRSSFQSITIRTRTPRGNNGSYTDRLDHLQSCRGNVRFAGRNEKTVSSGGVVLRRTLLQPSGTCCDCWNARSAILPGHGLSDGNQAGHLLLVSRRSGHNYRGIEIVQIRIRGDKKRCHSLQMSTDFSNNQWHKAEKKFAGTRSWRRRFDALPMYVRESCPNRHPCS